MKRKSYLDMFIDDCKYYDSDNIEVKTIIRNVNLKNKILLDVGCGIGRLSFPLSKYAKKVISLDSDKRFAPYFKKKKSEKVKFVNKKAEDYLKQKMSFDVVLLAWPIIKPHLINLIKRSMNKETSLIFITCDNNSDFETIIDKLNVVKKGSFDKEIKEKNNLLKKLENDFKIKVKKKVNTRYVYPNEKKAFEVIKNSMEMWFDVALDLKAEKRLADLIKKHKKGKKVIFGEKIYFYVANKK